MTVSGNNIIDNEYSYGSISLYRGYEKTILFVNNDIAGNHYRHIVVMNMEKTTYDLSKTPNIGLVGNVIANNTYSSGNSERRPSQPPMSAALVLDGYGNVCIQNNTLQNPGLETEVYVKTRASKWTDTTEARYNTWGCENTHCVRKRTYDAHNDMYLPEVRVLPFVSRSNEMVYTPDVTEGLPQGNVLGGWLNKSITLEAAGSPFYLKEDWTILPGVEVFIEPGVWIKPARDKGILVLGQIVARGEKGKRVAFGCQYQTAYCSYWHGLVFASDDVSTSPSELLFVDVFNAGYKGNTYGTAVQSFSPSIIMQNSRVIQSRLTVLN
ncbi:protein bark beetle-like isoform X2 [Lingula anatina]|uniref:Protein bark beetle-like isoform X2 n=1 Tax=Lingula anatina TaxID=7574 RepID=A0A1S3K1K1_LINAN|nr:protein bark beetle-like isoform X2 [Lingula anatina]|eukprot:XP_013416146.1 protein bark beetle-like isoform X2 [Lingula anatina]